MTNKDLISQYVDTGLKLPEYQVSKLSNNDKRTYIRKRLISIEQTNNRLASYEVELLDSGVKEAYVNNIRDEIFSRIKAGSLHDNDLEYLSKDEIIDSVRFLIKTNGKIGVNYKIFDELPDEVKGEYSAYKAKDNNQISDEMFNLLSNEDKLSYIRSRISSSYPLSKHMLDYGGDEAYNAFIDANKPKVFKHNYGLYPRHGKNGDEYDIWFEVLSDKYRILALNKIIAYAIEIGKPYSLRHVYVDEKYYPYLDIENKRHYLRAKMENNGWLSEVAFNDLSDEDKVIYANRRYGSRDMYIPPYIRPYMGENKDDLYTNKK